MKEELTDWKGNIIKEGDTLVIVRVTSRFTSIGLWGQPETFVDIPKYIWDICYKATIEVLGDRLFYRLYSGIATPLSSLEFYHPKNGSTIICIEGRSDNEQDYYMEYFKAV